MFSAVFTGVHCRAAPAHRSAIQREAAGVVICGIDGGEDHIWGRRGLPVCIVAPAHRSASRREAAGVVTPGRYGREDHARGRRGLPVVVLAPALDSASRRDPAEVRVPARHGGGGSGGREGADEEGDGAYPGVHRLEAAAPNTPRGGASRAYNRSEIEQRREDNV